jgi:hypothetical protein
LSSIDRWSKGIASAGRPSLTRRAPALARRSALRARADDTSGDVAAPAEIPGMAGSRNFELALEAFARKDSRSMAGFARGMRSAALAVFPGAPKRGEPAVNGTPPRCPFRDFAIDLLFVPVRLAAPTLCSNIRMRHRQTEQRDASRPMSAHSPTMIVTPDCRS